MGPQKPRVEFLVSADWIAMYINGHVVFQGHNIGIEAVEKVGGYLGFFVGQRPMTPEMVKTGRCPDRIEALRRGNNDRSTAYGRFYSE